MLTQKKMTPEAALDQASEIVGSMQALAEKLHVTKGAVGQWKLPSRRIPAEHCPAIERLTGGVVRCEVLRPDVDWAIVRASPALETAHAPARRKDDPPTPPAPGPHRRKDDLVAGRP
jgi:DNA-binding transcriptional regulator YdaS (Cro superfamily)